ncbi:multidrug/spermidine efflux SMR transporter subunit MdtI [Pectobacterium brasiliense]|uniref:multidrug/spermidine efflux SMR transporter subunit MdtI n=1 Tax=Pectobacterium brasiliense TaxID=180957 RepID=UPI001CE0DD4C|nr:multidrug/spermidine efflux SMR transporter subunit MdtI [Pectobacterium brasiliense]MCA5918345.1 multidrug/spermidine efflux SMR transporter subunit MdtI [Pectobacterium brasiliense]MCA5926116.1 multidrug/spermidine efflux SMR transporter subunit MdtI [Pectobacterium brasiliense]MCA5934209.1 multidrug/spermidine efflux SMR transporter subunit MdtI [Pectobacterium brasiliense]MCA5938391.1 multidrug/spermidine efflux SMR transporter subunit MdtI [Pectobacterium brasiliense]MCA5944021.1 multi
MQNAYLIHYAWMLVAILLEVAANIFVYASQGWSRRVPGIIGIFCILASFTALAQAVKGIDLSIAYALWGGTGIELTSMAGWALFRQRLGRQAFAGILLIVAGISLLKLS